MPLRPFPYQLGIGTDIIHVGRVRSILTKTNGSQQKLEKFLRRFLTPSEQQEFFKRYGTASTETAAQLNLVSKHLAGRWAAKEAVIKAVPWRRLAFHDIVISRLENDRGLLAVILDKKCGSADSTQSQTSSHEDMKHTPAESVTNEATRPPSMRKNGLIDDDLVSLDTDTGDSERVADEAFLSTPHALDPSGENDDNSNTPQYEHLSGQTAKISISHDGEYATAVCLAAQEPMDGDVGGEAAARELF